MNPETRPVMDTNLHEETLITRDDAMTPCGDPGDSGDIRGPNVSGGVRRAWA